MGNPSVADWFIFKHNYENVMWNMFKVNSEVCSKLTIKRPERRHVVLVFLLLTKPFSSVPIVDFEQVNVYWNNQNKISLLCLDDYPAILITLVTWYKNHRGILLYMIIRRVRKTNDSFFLGSLRQKDCSSK